MNYSSFLSIKYPLSNRIKISISMSGDISLILKSGITFTLSVIYIPYLFGFRAVFHSCCCGLGFGLGLGLVSVALASEMFGHSWLALALTLSSLFMMLVWCIAGGHMWCQLMFIVCCCCITDQIADGEGHAARQVLWSHPGNDVTGMVARSEKVAGICEKVRSFVFCHCLVVHLRILNYHCINELNVIIFVYRR